MLLTYMIHRSQYIFRLNKQKVLNLPERLADEVFSLFNYNYGPAMDQQRKDGVGYAAFNGLYYMIHYPIQVIKYRGNRKRIKPSRLLLLSVWNEANKKPFPRELGIDRDSDEANEANEKDPSSSSSSSSE